MKFIFLQIKQQKRRKIIIVLIQNYDKELSHWENKFHVNPTYELTFVDISHICRLSCLAHFQISVFEQFQEKIMNLDRLYIFQKKRVERQKYKREW